MKEFDALLALVNRRKDIIRQKYDALELTVTKKHKIPKDLVKLLSMFTWHHQLLSGDEDEAAIPQRSIFITATFELWGRDQAVAYMRTREGRNRNFTFLVSRRYGGLTDACSLLFF